MDIYHVSENVGMAVNKCWAACLFALAPGFVLADENNLKVSKAHHQGSPLQSDTKRVPLARVLDNLAKETGVRIHYSELPKGLVTVACVGTTVKQAMDYLLDRKIDFIFRSRPELTKGLTRNDPQNQPEEIWILGVYFAADQPTVLPASENCTGIGMPPNQTKKPHAQTNGIDQLVESIKAGDTAERADALALLAMAGGKDDDTIHNVLNKALSDDDANVRAQAVFSLSRREGAGAATALHAALLDKEPSVRLMAVDSAGDNAGLLQQALTDSDETVRALAEIRLEALSNDDDNKNQVTR